MKTTKILMACGLVLAGGVMMAQNAEVADLKNTAAAPEVQKQFDQPDGAAVFLKPDGSFQILARGTGTYDFDDVDDVNDARKEAALKAKAALAKFMKEKLSTEEGMAEQSKKVKSISSDGKTQTANISKESVKVSCSMVKNSAEALLKGVITLKEQRIPRKGTSGEIQVTVGVSSKTLKAVGKLVNAMDATPEQGRSNRGRSGAGGSAGNSGNKAETRVSDTDF